jgi:hypothetical protein
MKNESPPTHQNHDLIHQMDILPPNQIEATKYYLRVYLLATILLYIVSYIFAPITYPILGFLVGNGRFDDWWNTIIFLQRLPINAEFTCTVPWVFTHLLKTGGQIFGIFYSYIIFSSIAVLLTMPAYLELKNIYGRYYSVLIVFSYPILFGFWRGNSDLFIYGLIISFYFCFVKQNVRLSIIYCGLAILFKPYQVFYLLTFKMSNIYKNAYVFILGILAAVILIFIGDKEFFNSTWRNLGACSTWYTKEYVVGEGGTLHNNSLWGFFKFITYFLIGDIKQVSQVLNHASIYLTWWPLLLVVTFLCSKKYFILFENDKDSFSSSFFHLSLLIVILSPISPDYRLFFIVVCTIILLLNKIKDDMLFDYLIISMLVVLLPKEFIWFQLHGANFTTNGPINFILILFIYLYILVKGFLRGEIYKKARR